MRRALSRVISEGLYGRLQNCWLTKRGARRLISWANAPLLDQHGEVCYIICTGIDITERHQAEQALRESDERFRTIFELAPDGYYLADFNGVFLDGNRAAESVSGYSREELIGKDFFQSGLLSPEQSPRPPRCWPATSPGSPPARISSA